MSMKILVTGGCGFIGYNLIKKIKELWKDSIIYCLDDYSSGFHTNELENIFYINNHTKNILKINELENLFPKYIFHFGEYSRVSSSFDDCNDVFQSNTIGTQQVFEYAVRNKSKLIYSGSSATFGNNNLDQHLNPYVWTKAKNIELLHNYKKWYGLNFSICYFYNVYGDKQIKDGKYATLIGIFEKQYANNELLTVVKPGTQTRIFTYIDDVVDGIIKVALYGNGDGYFLYTDESYSIIEVAEMFKKDYKMIEERKGERKQSTIFPSKAYSELNWKPKMKLIDYINNFISSYKK